MNATFKPLLLFPLLFIGIRISAQCPTASETLDVNQVSARLNIGDMFWDFSDDKYEVPKGSGMKSIGASALWFGAVDDQGQLRVAAQSYRQYGTDFYAGPIDPNSDNQEAICELYDRLWKINAIDIETFKSAFANGNINSINDVAPAIRDWPGRNSNYGDFPIGDLEVAPFVDLDGDGNYDPLAGDYPDVLGDQAIWWIFNDRKEHNETLGEPLDIQVSVTAYAYNQAPLEYTTFYNYDILNAGTYNLNQLHVGQWLDVGLGCQLNDYVGSAPEADLAFVYNATLDSSNCSYGYDESLPILGLKFIEGLKDYVGLDMGMTSFMNYFNTDVIGNPTNAAEFYRILKAAWRDGTHLTFGGYGYGGTQLTNFMWPSNPAIQGSLADGIWSECAAGDVPWERRFVAASGPINLPAGARNSMTVAIVWDDSNTDLCPDINPFIEHVNEVVEKHDDLTSEVASGISEPPLSQSLSFYPNPMQTALKFEWSASTARTARPEWIEVRNLNGALILRESIHAGNSFLLKRQSLVTGMYIFQFSNKTKKLSSGKFLVE